MQIHNIDKCRSYSTEAKLVDAITDLFGTHATYIVVCNRNHRFTAIFQACMNPAIQPVQFAYAGFLTVN